MEDKATRSAWVKWIVASSIAVVGAGGGFVAVMQYVDSKREQAILKYQEGLREWQAFSPPSVSRGAHEVEILNGWHIDLDNGLVSMSQSGSWDLKFHRRKDNFEGILANSMVEWAHLGVVDFTRVGYRDIRDAEFTSVRPGRGDKYLYLSHVTAAPGPGYTFAVKTSVGNVAKVQVARYERHPSGQRHAILRYEVFPIVADPSRPRHP